MLMEVSRWQRRLVRRAAAEEYTHTHTHAQSNEGVVASTFIASTGETLLEGWACRAFYAVTLAGHTNEPPKPCRRLDRARKLARDLTGDQPCMPGQLYLRCLCFCFWTLSFPIHLLPSLPVVLCLLRVCRRWIVQHPRPSPRTPPSTPSTG